MSEENQPLTATEPLTKKERRHLRRQEKQKERQEQRRRKKISQLFKWLLWLIIIVLIVVGTLWIISNQKVLPPTTMKGHIEVSPESHILDQPLDLRVYKHMLEHADGSGPPGVIISYNCQDFDCAPDLLEKLKALTREFPDHVYLAPYPNMSAKLVLTRLNQQEIFESFDEQKIKNFINQ